MQRNTTDSSTRHSSSLRTICIATVPFGWWTTAANFSTTHCSCVLSSFTNFYISSVKARPTWFSVVWVRRGKISPFKKKNGKFITCFMHASTCGFLKACGSVWKLFLVSVCCLDRIMWAARQLSGGNIQELNIDEQFSQRRVEKWTSKTTSIAMNCSWPFYFSLPATQVNFVMKLAPASENQVGLA